MIDDDDDDGNEDEDGAQDPDKNDAEKKSDSTPQELDQVVKKATDNFRESESDGGYSAAADSP